MPTLPLSCTLMRISFGETTSEPLEGKYQPRAWRPMLSGGRSYRGAQTKCRECAPPVKVRRARTAANSGASGRGAKHSRLEDAAAGDGGCSANNARVLCRSIWIGSATQGRAAVDGHSTSAGTGSGRVHNHKSATINSRGADIGASAGKDLSAAPILYNVQLSCCWR